MLGRRKMKKLLELQLQTTVSEARVGRIMKKLNLCSLIRRKSTCRIRAKQRQVELADNLLN
ncbi:MAG: transposase [Burkholderiaceae bacterium]|nr:transposase [Burkholderiaceae bacterium]